MKNGNSAAPNPQINVPQDAIRVFRGQPKQDNSVAEADTPSNSVNRDDEETENTSTPSRLSGERNEQS